MSCNTDLYEEDDDAEISFSVGRRFLTGNGVEKNVAKARELLSQAASMGHRLAAQLLASIDETPQEEKVSFTEKEKMLRGDVYDACDAELLGELNATKDLVWEYNNMRPSMLDERKALLKKMLGQCDDDTLINQPFYCDYGKQIRVGKRFFANFNLTILDEARVTIGNDCFIGPNVSIYTACHSTDPIERNTRREWAEPVTIGNNVWIGGSVTILPGVTIGDNVTIGAGSVVVKDIESDSIAVGNPAKVIKKI